MTGSWRSIVVRGLVVAIVGVLLPWAVPRAVGAQGPDPTHLEARRLFDALDYENALRMLDQAIAALEGRSPDDPSRLDLLLDAYEMRARSKFGLGDQDGARDDFALLLKTHPGYSLTGQVSPRVVALFEETMGEYVTHLNVMVSPETANVMVNGVAVSAPGPIPVAVGDNLVLVEQPGYRTVRETVVAEAGVSMDLTITLERVSSVLSVLTSPPDVEVRVNGVPRGRTTNAPPSAQYSNAIAQSGVPFAEVSDALVLVDLPPGTHLIELVRDCYVRAETRVAMERPDDYTVGPLRLERAVATLSVRSNDPAAQIYIDGEARGVAPLTVPDLCEGEHTVELRAGAGRYFRRVHATAGGAITVDGEIKPAFALVSVSGQADGPIGADPRMLVERAFETSQAITLFAPPTEQAQQAVKANQLPDGWLAYGADGRPIGVSADIVPAMRRDASAKLAAAFGAQGVASLTMLDRNRVTLSLLAAGSSEPDILDVSFDVPESVTAALAALDRMPSFFRPSIGVVAVDVADVAGAVVVNVDPNGPAAQAGLAAGQTLTGVNGQPVTDAVSFATLLANHPGEGSLALEVRDRAGAATTATVPVSRTPRLIGTTDQTLLVNRILVALRARLMAPSDPLEESVVRLNLAAALARVEAWSEARTELQRVVLPDGPGVAHGTVQYLLGICAERLGNLSEAEEAFKAAAASEALLTEDGPAVNELAEARLAELQRRGRGAP